jgi:hypothetical protein
MDNASSLPSQEGSAPAERASNGGRTETAGQLKPILVKPEVPLKKRLVDFYSIEVG